jgi:hypothetical protein
MTCNLLRIVVVEVDGIECNVWIGTLMSLLAPLIVLRVKLVYVYISGEKLRPLSNIMFSKRSISI